MAKLPIGTGLKAGWSISRFFKLFFFVLFFGYLFLSIIITGIQERNFNFIMRELGEEFINPVQSAQEFSIEMQQTDTGLLKSLWEYWGFYFELMKIYIWVYIIKKLLWP